MSDYGYYAKKDVDETYKNGQKEGLFRGILIGLVIGCAATAFICYRQFGPPSQVPNLSLLIGDMRRAKDDSEGIVHSIKNRWQAHIISDADVRVGASSYRDLASRFNGISATLEAMISTGHDDGSIDEIHTNLVDAQRRYQAFRAWFDGLPRELPQARPRADVRPDGHAATGATKFEALPELAIDLAKHFFDGLNEMDKLKREHLIGLLQEVRFRMWSEVN